MKILKKIKTKWIVASTVVAAGSYAAMTPAFAEPSMKELMGRIIDLICDLFLWTGIVLLIWGVGQLILALKNDDADSKTKAIWLIVVSAALIGFKAIKDSILTGIM